MSTSGSEGAIPAIAPPRINTFCPTAATPLAVIVDPSGRVTVRTSLVMLDTSPTSSGSLGNRFRNSLSRLLMALDFEGLADGRQDGIEGDGTKPHSPPRIGAVRECHERPHGVDPDPGKYRSLEGDPLLRASVGHDQRRLIDTGEPTRQQKRQASPQPLHSKAGGPGRPGASPSRPVHHQSRQCACGYRQPAIRLAANYAPRPGQP